jgi:hypothetical protein
MMPQPEPLTPAEQAQLDDRDPTYMAAYCFAVGLSARIQYDAERLKDKAKAVHRDYEPYQMLLRVRKKLAQMDHDYVGILKWMEDCGMKKDVDDGREEGDDANGD